MFVNTDIPWFIGMVQVRAGDIVSYHRLVWNKHASKFPEEKIDCPWSETLHEF